MRDSVQTTELLAPAEHRQELEPRSQEEPGYRELLALVLFSCVVMWSTLFLCHQRSGFVLQFGDTQAYCDVANAIIHWDFSRVSIQHFMGYPYAIALLSLGFHLPTVVSLWLLAAGASVGSVLLTSRLFGTTTAAYFALTNFAWLQVSFLGGSEPLAVALGLGALLLFRRDRVFRSALAASLAVTVRPLMVFVLVGTGLVLLRRRRYGSFLLTFGTALAVGIAYVLPLARHFGDPLLTVHSYTTRDYGGGGIRGPHGHLFGWPFHGIIAGTLAYRAPWSNLVVSFFWIGFVLAGVGLMFSKNFRQHARRYPAEAIFCALYLLATFSYDYLLWARSNFIRFSIPALPFVFFAWQPILPKNRKIFWCLAVISPVLAAFSAMGVKNVLGHVVK